MKYVIEVRRDSHVVATVEVTASDSRKAIDKVANMGDFLSPDLRFALVGVKP